jgi:hypothetical protein
VGLSTNRSTQLGVNQVLHPSLHKPTEQISRIGVAQTGNKVSNSGIIIVVGHRVFISLVTTWS